MPDGSNFTLDAATSRQQARSDDDLITDAARDYIRLAQLFADAPDVGAEVEAIGAEMTRLEECLATLQATSPAGLAARAMAMGVLDPLNDFSYDTGNPNALLTAQLRDGAALAPTLIAVDEGAAFLVHLDAYDALEAELGRLAKQHGDAEIPPHVEVEMKRVCRAQESEAQGMVRVGCLTERGRQRLALTLSRQGVCPEKDDPRQSPEDRMEALLIRSAFEAARAPIFTALSLVGPDAELIAASAEHRRLIQELNSTGDAQLGTPAAEAEAKEQDRILNAAAAAARQMCGMVATTSAGLAARAMAMGYSDPGHAFDYEHKGGSRRLMLDALLRDGAALGGTSAPNPDAALLALKPEYDRLRAEYDAFNASPPIEGYDPFACAGQAYDDFCLKLALMPPARTAAGRALKAQAVQGLHVYVDDGAGHAHDAIRAFLREIAEGGAS